MSPGPKQIAGIPALFRIAASVHALIPSMDGFSPSATNALRSIATTGAPTLTSLGDCDSNNLTCARSSGRLARTRSHAARTSVIAASARSPGRVLRSILTRQRSG
jgi:hypothetical protein